MVQGFLGKCHFFFALFMSQYTLKLLILQAILLFQEALISEIYFYLLVKTLMNFSPNFK